MLNQLIYGDIRSSSGSGDAPPDLPDFYPGEPSEDYDSVPNELLHSGGGRLIYSDGCGVILWTWWEFSQSSEKNAAPIAYINGKEVCPGHSTDHIIDYTIKRNKIYGSKGSVTVYVKMKMGPSGVQGEHWNGGASCTHRIWAGDGGPGGYYDADPKHRREKGGTCGGGATFKVVFDTNAGTYRIS